MYLLRKHLMKLSTVGILAVSIEPFVKIKDEYIKKEKILFELDNRHKEDNMYYKYPSYIIDQLYEENSNIDIDKLIKADNKIKTICNIPTYILFKPIQIYKKYHTNRQLYELFNYFDGVMYGKVYKEYYDNRRLKSIYFSSNDKKNGIFKEYYENGKPKMICTYIDDIKNGTVKTYYNNGQVFYICNYIDGKIDGIYMQYHMNGQLWIDTFYKNSELNGTYKEYDMNGKLIRLKDYKY
jgi:hypothetical protein